MSDIAQALRASAWDAYVSCMLGFSKHPGQTKLDAKPMTRAEILAEADAMLLERDARFGTGEGP